VRSKHLVSIVAVAPLLGGATCGPPPKLAAPTHLDLGNVGGQDDDPTLISAADGDYHLVFISDRGGTGVTSLWATKSSDGISWDPPLQVSRPTNADDNFPTMLQTPDGLFHLAWSRFNHADGTTHVYYNTSPDGVIWDANAEIALTSGTVDDTATGFNLVGASELRIYLFSSLRSSPFSGTNDLFVMRSQDGGQTWSAPSSLANLSGPTQDRYASVIPLGGQYVMTFNRQLSKNLLDPTSDVYTSTSPDGLTWSSPTQITSDSNNVIPDLWPGFVWGPTTMTWYVTWASGREQSTGTWYFPPSIDPGGGMLALPLNGAFPADLIDMPSQHHMTGWDTRAAGSLIVWVNTTAMCNSMPCIPQLFVMTNPL
jgi:hypothetical protein